MKQTRAVVFGVLCCGLAALPALAKKPLVVITLDWRPTTTVTVDEDRAGSLLKLLDVLEDNDDVQNVYANFDIPEQVMAALSG